MLRSPLRHLFLTTTVSLLSFIFTTGLAQPSDPSLRPVAVRSAADEFSQPIDKINDFSFYFSSHQADTPTGNEISSPFSLISAFGLLYPGTSGQVSGDLQRYFHFDRGVQNLASFQQRINQRSDHGVRIANSLWLDQNLAIKSAYQQTLRRLFSSQAHRVNFSNPQLAASQINAWAQKNTSGFIRHVVTRQDLEKTNFALVNSIYFHAKWASPFASRATRMQTFYTAPGIEKSVHMMHQLNRFGYYTNDRLQVIDLPYQGDHYEMRVILPKAGVSLKKVQDTLNSAVMRQWDKQVSYGNLVHLSLPRFSASKKMYLKKWLKKDGLRSPFDGKHTGDFKGMTDGNILISKVIQKAKIEVNEQGTKAAAATVIGGMVTATASPRFNLVNFNANHPFIYVIRDKASGCVLFTGVERSPA
jgi:serpin B